MKRALILFSFVLLSACVGSGGQSLPSPDQLQFPPLHFEFPEVQKQQLSNGIRLYVKEDHELPLVDLSLLVGGGSIDDPVSKVGLSQLFAAAMESGGAGDLSPAALEAELEKMAAVLNVSSSSYSYRIDLSLRQQDLQRGLEILAMLLRQPRFDSQRLELARQQMLEGIRRQNDDPGAIASRLLGEAVFPGHPFGRVPTTATVQAISRADLLTLHQRWFHPGNLWIAVSGDVNQDQLVELLNQNFADWSPEKVVSPQPPPLPASTPARILVAEKDIPQTTILMGEQGISKDNPDMFPLRVANYILGGGGFNSRLMREIRSNRGLAYSVYSYFDIGRRLPELFIASSETKTSSTTEVVGLMRREIAKFISQPVSQAELELAKQSLINSFVFAFTDTHSVVSRRMILDFYDYPEGYLETYQKRIAAVTVADVQRVAAQYLHPGKMKIVLVGDSPAFLDNLQQFELPVEQVDLDAGEQGSGG